MAKKVFVATCYVEIDTDEADGPEYGFADAVKSYCEDAVCLDVDTEEYGNPCGVTSLEIDWDSLQEATEVEDGPLRDDVEAAGDAVGRDVEPDEVRDAIARWGHLATPALQAILEAKKVAFDQNGGRGVDLADEIDQLEMVVAVRKRWRK